ncbi:MAG: hypothetical protein RSA10_01315 [Bacilli bacterium]
MAKKTQKTHKGTKKVLNVRKNDVKIGKPGGRHNTGSKNTAFSRKNRAGETLSKSDSKRLKRIIDTL